MRFLLYGLSTLLRLLTVVASPNLLAVPAYGLSPYESTEVEEVVDCSPADTACAANRRRREYHPNECPPGTTIGGSYCSNPYTRVYVCKDGHGKVAHVQVVPCADGTRCVLITPDESVCIPNENTLVWPLEYPSNNRRIYSQAPKLRSAIINNYYGPNGAPIRVHHTSFIGQPRGENEGDSYFNTAAGSSLIDWGFDQSVLITVEDSSTTAGITVVTFLSPAVFH